MQHNQVLVVDDDPDVVRGVVRILRAQGYSAIPAIGGREAVVMTHLHRPMVVLMDIRMPDLNGVEASWQIKQLLPEAKIVFLTGYSEMEYQVIRDGAEVLLNKPIDYRQLFDLLDRLLPQSAAA